MSVFETLFYPFKTGALERPEAAQKILFLNAQDCAFLSEFSQHPLCQQVFKPYAQRLQERGYRVVAGPEDIEEGFDLVLLHTPKNKIEAQYLMAHAVRVLKEDGVLICAAANDAGGNRLAKFIDKLDFKNAAQESKNKARVVWGEKAKLNETISAWIDSGGMQRVLNGQYISQPGIFGWNKIDEGSRILLQHMPQDIKGKGADFGCGYGYLSHFLLQQNYDIQSLVCIDADIRAVCATQQNMEGSEFQVTVRWEDLTAPVAGLQDDLDFILMNPPFHEGKKNDSDIGSAFIKTAAGALRSGGKLYMVANRQLPYENVIAATFSRHEKLFEGNGFKIFEAVK